MDVKKIYWKEMLFNAAGVITGVMAGTLLKKTLQKNAAVEKLQGDTKEYAVPAVLSVGGIVCGSVAKNAFLKSASLGLTAVGAAGILNETMGKQVVTLGSVEPETAYDKVAVKEPIAMPRQVPVLEDYKPVEEHKPIAGVKGLEPGVGSVNGLEPGVGSVTVL